MNLDSNRVGRVELARKAIEAFGGGAKLARALGLTKPAVQLWKGRGIPAARVIDVARLTGIPCSELRPDIYPERMSSSRSDDVPGVSS
jgi:DNA-binding transcriptional regulator YdaS (Cro superfamily)